MAELETLTVEQRKKMGKSGSRELRRGEDFIPGIYYNAQGENIPVRVRSVPLKKMYSKMGTSHVFTLRIEEWGGGGESIERPCFIWEMQEHPTKNLLLHVDFYGVDMSKPVQVSIPVNTIGTPVGVVEDGGQLQVYQYDLNIESLPDKVPHSIDIDVSELKIGDNIMVEELKAPEGVEILFEDNFAVVGVTTMAELPEEIEEGEEVEAEEGAEAPEVEGEGEAEAEA